LGGSDNWVTILDAIADLSPAQRQAAYDSISGEALSDITSMVAIHGNRFNDLLRDRVSHGANLNTGNISTVAAAINGDEGVLRTVAPVASNSSALAGDGSGASAWIEGFGSSGQLDGDYNTASVDNFAAGIAAGVSFEGGYFKFGVAGAYSDVESSVDARLSRNEGKLYQAGAYIGYDDGSTFASAVGSYFGGTIDTTRNIFVNPTLTAQATGNADTKGYTVGGSVGYRFELGDGLILAPQLSGDATQVTRDAFTETGAGALSLAVARERRNLYTGIGEARLSHRGIMANGGVVEPYVSVGVRVNFGDLDTLSNMRFSGAPVGTGAFTIEGARLAKTSALFGGGINARPSENITIGVDVASTVSSREKEGRFSVNLKIGF
jgi:fibronectin-binding autotransporter adhesin